MDLSAVTCRSRRNSSEDEDKKFELMMSRLIKAGFPSNRCLKSLSATGFQSERLAAQWLVSHVNDAHIDQESTREYFVFLCPEGDLVSAVQEYWQSSQKLCGWNSAHEYPPHITLLPPFQVPDHLALNVHKLLTDVTNSFYDRCLPPKIPLQLYTNNQPANFIGYVVPGQVKSVLEDYTNEMLAQLKKAGVIFPSEVLAKRKGIYHLSLAYGFQCGSQAELMSLLNTYLPASMIEADCRWEIRLLSRDPRLATRDVETYEMKTSLETTKDLSFQAGDHVALLGSCDPPRHGWGMGLNSNTGLSGPFCLTAAERVPQYHSWTLHRCLPFSNSLPGSPSSLNGDVTFSTDPLSLSSSSNGKATGSRSNEKSRHLFIMRHAERMDMTFGRGWVTRCFDQRGVYKRLNLNMPSSLPPRPYLEFAHDSPITQMGRLVSQEVGRAMVEAGVVFTHCYTSPALRCVQTATQLLLGCGQAELSIRIEAHLFEWLGWYGVQMPRFMNSEELHAAGFNVDLGYRPHSTVKDYNITETPEKYYERTAKVVKKVLEAHKKKGVCILLIGHAGSLDTVTNPLLSKTTVPSNVKEFTTRASRVPYCGLAVVEEKKSKWQLVDPPVPIFTVGHNADVDWKFHG